MHDDRCGAVAHANSGTDVIGIQFTERSQVYDWQPQPAEDFQKLTLFKADDHEKPNGFALMRRLISACIKANVAHVFLCHYERPAITISAMILRLFGKRVFLLYDSKFDDYARFSWREILKSLWLWPYNGALAASKRSKDYLCFLGMRPENIQLGYNSISIERIRGLVRSAQIESECPFSSRHFTIVARLIDKKNLVTALKAYAIYARGTDHPRSLRLFGSGPLEVHLHEEVLRQKIEHLVSFEGFQQADVICRALATSLALLLISEEEQFGIAIIEALAAGVPVIISPACGAHDEFVRTGVNGFVVEPDNPEGIAFFMTQLSMDEGLWRQMAKSAFASAERVDVAQFARAVEGLTGNEPGLLLKEAQNPQRQDDAGEGHHDAGGDRQA